MKLSRIIILMTVLLSVQIGASASQIMTGNTPAVSFNFGFSTETPALSLDSQSTGFDFTGLELYKSESSSGNNFAKAAKAMHWVWIGGLIGTIVTGAMVATGTVLMIVGFANGGYLYYGTNPNNIVYNAAFIPVWSAGVYLFGTGLGLLLGLALPCLIAGLILEKFFLKRSQGAFKIEMRDRDEIGLIYSYKL